MLTSMETYISQKLNIYVNVGVESDLLVKKTYLFASSPSFCSRNLIYVKMLTLKENGKAHLISLTNHSSFWGGGSGPQGLRARGGGQPGPLRGFGTVSKCSATKAWAKSVAG